MGFRCIGSLSDRLSRAMALFAITALVVGCAGPVALNDRFAAAQEQSRSVLRGTDFSHVIYTTSSGEGPVWHVYIDGDGQPWQSRTSVAHDPTSAMPLMLRLMQQDAAPRLYLGRPCYQGMLVEAACKPWVWTHGRYSEPVVASLQTALEKLIDRHAIRELAMFGHSGGGTLVMLLAERIPQTKMVVTLAGNLDTKAWTRMHGYAELAGSLNPADRPELPRRISQFHFRGAEDQILPSEVYEKLGKRPSVYRQYIFDGVGHTTGWEVVYCDILTRTGGQCKSL